MKLDHSSHASEVVTAPRLIEGGSALVERVIEESGRAYQESRIELPSGRVVEARAEGGGDDRVTIRSASGEVELEVRMTERGPVLRFRAADLELASAGDVRIDCDRLHVRAAQGIRQETGGDLKQTVAGDAVLEIGGRLQAAANEAQIRARRGDVEIEANDDVKLRGERIKLNC